MTTTATVTNKNTDDTGKDASMSNNCHISNSNSIPSSGTHRVFGPFPRHCILGQQAEEAGGGQNAEEAAPRLLVADGTFKGSTSLYAGYRKQQASCRRPR